MLISHKLGRLTYHAEEVGEKELQSGLRYGLATILHNLLLNARAEKELLKMINVKYVPLLKEVILYLGLVALSNINVLSISQINLPTCPVICL